MPDFLAAFDEEPRTILERALRGHADRNWLEGYRLVLETKIATIMAEHSSALAESTSELATASRESAAESTKLTEATKGLERASKVLAGVAIVQAILLALNAYLAFSS